MNLKNRIKSIEKTVQMQKGEARTVRVEFVDVDVPEFTDEEIADCERLKLKYDEEYKNELARVEQLAAAGKDAVCISFIDREKYNALLERERLGE